MLEMTELKEIETKDDGGVPLVTPRLEPILASAGLLQTL
jgi:hypothetical protein